jgi:hypothetical protein
MYVRGWAQTGASQSHAGVAPISPDTRHRGRRVAETIRALNARCADTGATTAFSSSVPAEKIRERFENGRVNLIRLLPHLTELYLYDNSAEADLDSGAAPLPRRLLYYRERQIVSPTNLKTWLEATPAWAKPIVAAAIKLHLSQRG